MFSVLLHNEAIPSASPLLVAIPLGILQQVFGDSSRSIAEENLGLISVRPVCRCTFVLLAAQES